MTYNITLTANHQSLTAEYLPLAAESVQYLTAKVVCETEDWTGREIKALFGQGCTVYEIPVTGGEITAKQQLNLTAGDWRVWLVGNSARDGEVIPRITTNVAHISVAPTGGTEGNPFPTIPPTAEEQLRADMGNLADLTTEDKSSLVAAINEAAESGGSKDAVTYTPQTLTTEQQNQARANIGAGQPVFVVNVTEVSGGGGYTADKTAAEIEAAYQAGRTIVCKTQADFWIASIPVELPLVSRNQERVFIFAVDQLMGENALFTITVNISDSGVEANTREVEIYKQPVGGIPKSDLADDVQTSLDKADAAISLGLTAATPGQIIKVKAVQDGKPTEWEAVDMPSGGGGTKMEEVTETVTVSSENVTLDSGASSQTVNLAWNVPGSKTIPPFTNYYSNLNGTTYPRELGGGYNQFWSSSVGHGNADAFDSAHKYFMALKYELDGDSTAYFYPSVADYITPTNSTTLSGSGWIYAFGENVTAGAAAWYINSLSGTGRVYYVYCIDVTALQEAGTITATTINELAELFGGLELIPGQNYGGSTISGMATLSITRDGEITTVDSGTATATVQGGDILSVDGGSVTFLLKVLREVYVDPISVWSGKKWVAFGDSLTDETINADKKYYRYIEEKTGITVVVMGQSGTGYYKAYDSGTAYGQRMANVPADADIITIFGSVNDWHTNSAGVAMGNASDTMEAGTLAGYINECIDVAIEKAPYAQIALVTPMDYHGLPDDILEGIANIIKAVAAYRKIKCLDLYHESGFRVDNPTFAAVYTTDYSETAESYGHPSNLAHEQLIAPEFMELLKRMLLTA